MASGSELTYDNSLIEASNRLTLKSGGDTTLSGAQLKAKEVSGNIGGDLKVVTLQDSSKYDSKQTSGGFSISLCIPPTLAFIQGQVDITGTGDAATEAKSQAAAATLTRRDASTAKGALSNSLSLQEAGKLQQELQTERDNARAAQLVGQVTTNAIGDLADKQDWKEGSWQKTALHGMAGAIEAAIAGGKLEVGALAGMANEQLIPVLKAYLKSQDITEEKDPQNFKALMKAGGALAGLAVGAVVSGGDAQNTALAGSVALTATENNRLLHPKERDVVKEKAKILAAKENCGQNAQCSANAE